MNLHQHSLPVPKDRPGHLSHCALAAVLSHRPAHEQTRTGQHGRREIDDRSEALELQSCGERTEKQNPPPQLGEMAKEAVHLICGGSSPHVHTEAPAPVIYSWSDTRAIKAFWLSSQVFHPCVFLMSGEVVVSISNLHELIGHCCVPFPLITEAWHFSLSPHLIYAQVIHSLVNYKVQRQQFDSSCCVLRKQVWNPGCVLCSLLYTSQCECVHLFVYMRVNIGGAVW